MDKGTILVVEDEPNIADLVDLYLSREGFRVVKKATGTDGLDAIRDQQPRLVVLDVGLPDLDGLEVCRRIRATSALPVIFLTARADEVDRVLGLELGADDYLTKPFAPAELVARVKAVLRRTDGVPGAALVQVGGVVVDLGRREIRVDDDPVDFTTKEFELLRFLAERPGLAMSRHQILDAVWGHGWYGDERTVDVHIAQVRKKVGDACTIATVRGVGYRLEPAPRVTRSRAAGPAVSTSSPPAPTGRRRTLRRRLLVAMAAIALGVVVVTGVTTVALARRGAERTAISHLEDQAPDVRVQLRQLGRFLRTRELRGLPTVGVGRLVTSVLRVTGGTLLTVHADGTITEGVDALAAVR